MAGDVAIVFIGKKNGVPVTKTMGPGTGLFGQKATWNELKLSQAISKWGADSANGRELTKALKAL